MTICRGPSDVPSGNGRGNIGAALTLTGLAPPPAASAPAAEGDKRLIGQGHRCSMAEGMPQRAVVWEAESASGRVATGGAPGSGNVQFRCPDLCPDAARIHAGTEIRGSRHPGGFSPKPIGFPQRPVSGRILHIAGNPGHRRQQGGVGEGFPGGWVCLSRTSPAFTGQRLPLQPRSTGSSRIRLIVCFTRRQQGLPAQGWITCRPPAVKHPPATQLSARSPDVAVAGKTASDSARAIRVYNANCRS